MNNRSQLLKHCNFFCSQTFYRVQFDKPKCKSLGLCLFCRKLYSLSPLQNRLIDDWWNLYSLQALLKSFNSSPCIITTISCTLMSWRLISSCFLDVQGCGFSSEEETWCYQIPELADELQGERRVHVENCCTFGEENHPDFFSFWPGS